MNIAQGPAAQRQTLGFHIDVYECPHCGARFVTTADHLTFKAPAPLECKRCEFVDMVGRRFVDGSLHEDELVKLNRDCKVCGAKAGKACTVISGGPDGDPRLDGDKPGEPRAVPHWAR